MTNQSREQKQKREKQKPRPQADATGQFAPKRHGGENDGVASADPRVTSGKESGDATFDEDPESRTEKRKR